MLHPPVDAAGGAGAKPLTIGATLPPQRLETGPSAATLSPVLSIAAYLSCPQGHQEA